MVSDRREVDQRAAGSRRLEERAGEVVVSGGRRGTDDRLLVEEDRPQVDRQNGDGVVRLEDDRLLALRGLRLRLGALGTLSGFVGAAVNVRYALAGSAGSRGMPSRFRNASVVLLRRLVQPVDQALAEPGEELDQGDAEVARAVVGPLRRVASG